MGKKLSRVEKLGLGFLFNDVWEYLADSGACDGLGGAEYRRLIALWQAERYPLPIEVFIRLNASFVPADGTFPDDDLEPTEPAQNVPETAESAEEQRKQGKSGQPNK